MSLDWPYGLIGFGGVASVTGSDSGLPYTAHVLLYTSWGGWVGEGQKRRAGTEGGWYGTVAA